MCRKDEESGVHRTNGLKLWYSPPVSALFVLLILEVAEAPRSYIAEGEPVYQWPDSRITLLACLFLIFLLLFVHSIGRPRLLRLTALSSFALAASMFVLFVSFNYGTNGPDGVLPRFFSPESAMVILGFLEGMRLSPPYGLAPQALAWFFTMVVSVFFLRSGRGMLVSFLESVIFASLVLVTYGLGVHAVIPQWSNMSVSGVLDHTPLSWLTNDELVASGLVVSVGSVAARSRVARRSPQDG